MDNAKPHEPRLLTYTVPGPFELVFKDRERDALWFTDARAAGAAFYGVRHDLLPRVVRHETLVTQDRQDPTDRTESPSKAPVAVTWPAADKPGGYEHVFLAHWPDFRAGYEEARQRQPHKAVSVSDLAEPGLPPGEKPRSERSDLIDHHAPMKGAAMDEQQPGSSDNSIQPAPVPAPAGDQPQDAQVPQQPQAASPAREQPPAQAPAAAQQPQAPAAEQPQVSEAPPQVQVQVQPAIQPADDPDARARAQRRQALVDGLSERFTVRGNDYCFMRDGQVAFTDHGNRLATKSDTPFVARSMVDLAEAKGWDALTLKGSEDFRRAAWLEAASRGLEVRGYNPTVQDRQQLAERQPAQQAPQHNSIEPTPGLQQGDTQRPGAPGRDQATTTAQPVKAEGSTKQQHLEVMQAILKQQGVEPFQARAVLARMAEVMDARLARGEPLPQLKVFDARAQTQAPMHVPQPTQQPVRTQTVSR
ncbi:LPD7 domain-containing protein [Azohydromonas australica]|uniref:LPD7 domain-containing protein n=1 Tax=Azohydromonas australica TaxID=364039 RepID=UPI000410606D|nr:LPD7 domain-containing protein [Azohydromonas australica]